MLIKTPVAGMVVESICGRDCGKAYVVCDVKGNELFLADGIKRTLASPKKKNIKHVRLTPVNVADGGIVAPWDKAFDGRIAWFLKNRERADNDKSED